MTRRHFLGSSLSAAVAAATPGAVHANALLQAMTVVSSSIVGQTGVNLEEELANMILFQNAFNASARLLQTTREMFQELLAINR